MDNKFGMEQQETEEDITKEKVFCWSLFLKAFVHFKLQNLLDCSS